MKNMNIYLNTPEDAINFVSTVSKVPYEADLSYGHCMVDAKSILGLMALDYHYPVKVVTEDVNFLKKLDKWAVDD